MKWDIVYLPEARKDLLALDGSRRVLVIKAINKVSENPLPANEGGLGKPLGNKNGNDLSGFLKIKLRAAGLRVVYQLIRQKDRMLVVVIGARADEEVYDTARQRADKRGL